MLFKIKIKLIKDKKMRIYKIKSMNIKINGHYLKDKGICECIKEEKKEKEQEKKEKRHSAMEHKSYLRTK